MRTRLLLAFLLVVCGCGSKPPEPPLLEGPTHLRPHDELRLSVWAVDPDEDSLAYQVSWGNGQESDWSQRHPSGERAGFAHAYSDTGWFELTARARNRKKESPVSDPFYARVYEYGPNRPGIPRLASGRDTVAVADSFGVMATATHPLAERVSLQFDWGDTLGDWSHYFPPDSWLRVRHAYFTPGSYALRVRARDISDYVSDWSDSTVIVAIPEDR